MKKIVGSMLIGLVLLVVAGDLSASMRGICRGYGAGRVNVHIHSGSRYRSSNDDLIFLLMISSTSTSIYCISIADQAEDWGDSRRQRYSLINYDRLKEEGSRGYGEYLAALSYSMGCPAAMHGEFATSVQRTYRRLFETADQFQAEQFINRLQEMISSNPKLSSSCMKGSSLPEKL